MSNVTAMQEFTATELANRTGDVLAAAAQAPVRISRHSKVRYVILTTERFERLLEARDTRRVLHVSELDDAETDALVAALRASIADD